ncbi:hypothetical protein CK203_096668 [Vitis vinifera]|uniref:Uncharacterized protein n=1 Tax=Vitis vinifera TaxID=29760 RepID=A0A438DBM0_VITVI|nr:hypothetical protein CK203_096668 [Vitis vinifera]
MVAGISCISEDILVASLLFINVQDKFTSMTCIECSAGTSTTPSTTTPSTTPSTTTPSTTPSTTTPSTTTPSTTSPYTGTPSTGVYGGINSGVGPSGAGINTDISHGGNKELDVVVVGQGGERWMLKNCAVVVQCIMETRRSWGVIVLSQLPNTEPQRKPRPLSPQGRPNGSLCLEQTKDRGRLFRLLQLDHDKVALRAGTST